MSRYRDDRDDQFETRRGRARSYAEEKFFEAQRDRESNQHETDDSRQFDYGPMDREQRERDSHRSAGLGTSSDRPRRDSDDRGDYYRPPAGDTGMRYDHNYERRSVSARDEHMEDDYGRRRPAYEERGAEGRPRGASRSHVRCRDIMTRDVTVATRDMTLDQIAQMMRDEDTGVIPVVEQTNDTASPTATTVATGAATQAAPEGGARRGERTYGKLVGLITDRDIVIRSIADGKNATQVKVEEIMTADVHTAEPNDRVIDAIRKMGDKQVRRIPVCDSQGNLRGIISMADVALETEEDRELAHALEEISSGASFWGKMFG